MKTIRVGSRESRLAVVQSELVMDAIRAAHPEVGLELVTMKTTGDKILDRTMFPTSQKLPHKPPRWTPPCWTAGWI